MARHLFRSPAIPPSHLSDAAPIWISSFSITRNDPIGVPMPHHFQLLYLHLLRRTDMGRAARSFNSQNSIAGRIQTPANIFHGTLCLLLRYLMCLRATTYSYACDITNVVRVPEMFESPPCNPTPLPKLATPVPWHSWPTSFGHMIRYLPFYVPDPALLTRSSRACQSPCFLRLLKRYRGSHGLDN